MVPEIPAVPVAKQCKLGAYRISWGPLEAPGCAFASATIAAMRRRFLQCGLSPTQPPFTAPLTTAQPWPPPLLIHLIFPPYFPLSNPHLKIIQSFLEGWKPFAELPADLTLRGQILEFLGESDPMVRKRHFASANGLYRLHNRYRELEMSREDKSGRTEQFELLFTLDLAEFAAAIERKEQKNWLVLLQFCFEFGRYQVPPRHHLMREFIHHMLDQEINAAPIKYSVYGDGVLYSGGGKTHDEMAQDFIKLGMGGGRPVAGGLLSRTGTYEFLYDLSSTTFRGGDPALVTEGLARWIRGTGGREDKIKIKLDTTRMEA